MNTGLHAETSYMLLKSSSFMDFQHTESSIQLGL